MKKLGVIRLFICLAAIITELLPLGAVLKYGLMSDNGHLIFRFENYSYFDVTPFRIRNVPLYDMRCDNYYYGYAFSAVDILREETADADHGAFRHCSCDVGCTVYYNDVQRFYRDNIRIACGGAGNIGCNADKARIERTYVMARSSNQKQKILYIEKMFREESDELHALTVAGIQEKLERLGITAERKALYSDIETLRDILGMDICSDKNGTYYLASRDFEFEELQLLADAVACSKFISEEKSRALIGKIAHLTSNFRANELQRSVIVANRVKTVNKKIYYSINKIHEAIENGRKITFHYFNYDIKKRKIFRNADGRYTMSPYHLAWEDENYYCIGFYEKYNSVSNFRVDRMEDVEVSDEPAIISEDFNLAEYTRKIFGMFAGKETIRIKLRFDNSLTSVVMDKFGSDITMHKLDENNFYISKDINVSPTFYGWLFQLGVKAEIIEPLSARNDFVAFIDSLRDMY